MPTIGDTAGIFVGDTTSLIHSTIDTSNLRSDTGLTHHFQTNTLGFINNGGSTHDIVGYAKPLPVDFSNGTGKTFLDRVDGGLTYDNTNGGTAFYVKIDGSSGITVSANLGGELAVTGEVSIHGITVGNKYPILVGGYRGATAHAIVVTGDSFGGNLGVTGQILAVNAKTAPLYINGTGAASGEVGVTGQIAVIGGPAATPVLIAGTGNNGHVGVTGNLSIKGLSGGRVPIISLASDGITIGVTSGDLTPSETGLCELNFGVTHGLSSGVRFQAVSTGVSTDFVYIGSQVGMTGSMYMLRDYQTFGDTVFIEVDNMNKIYIASDNSSVDVRYIGS